MVKNATCHLDEERLIEAVLDEAGLEEATRRHLIECAACREQKEVLEQKLARFGQMSRRCMPEPFRRPRLAGAKFGNLKPQWKIRPSFGMGLAIASVLAVLLSTVPFRHKQVQVYNVQLVYAEMAQDKKLLTEVDGLVENPLPRLVVEIADPADNGDDIQIQRPSLGGAG
jgi:hypothetical protein